MALVGALLSINAAVVIVLSSPSLDEQQLALVLSCLDDWTDDKGIVYGNKFAIPSDLTVKVRQRISQFMS